MTKIESNDVTEEVALDRITHAIEWTYDIEEMARLLAKRSESLSEEDAVILESEIEQLSKKLEQRESLHDSWYPNDPQS